MDHKDQDKPKPVNDLLENVHFLPSSKLTKRSLGSGQPETSRVIPLRIELLEQLWQTMTETYGHRWTSSFGVLPKPDHAWAKHLTGLNGRQIANGLALMSNLDTEGWPPSAPQFRKLCLEVHGLPPTDQAWGEALQGKYSHDAVRIAAENTGTFDLRAGKATDRLLRQRFEREYAIVMRRAQTGQPLDGRSAKGIGHETKTPMQVQLAQSHREARELVTAQGIPTDGQTARQLLLARLGIRQEQSHA